VDAPAKVLTFAKPLAGSALEGGAEDFAKQSVGARGKLSPPEIGKFFILKCWAFRKLWNDSGKFPESGKLKNPRLYFRDFTTAVNDSATGASTVISSPDGSLNVIDRACNIIRG
jgi:hypothetical protein